MPTIEFKIFYPTPLPHKCDYMGRCKMCLKDLYKGDTTTKLDGHRYCMECVGKAIKARTEVL